MSVKCVLLILEREKVTKSHAHLRCLFVQASLYCRMSWWLVMNHVFITDADLETSTVILPKQPFPYLFYLNHTRAKHVSQLRKDHKNTFLSLILFFDNIINVGFLNACVVKREVFDSAIDFVLCSVRLHHEVGLGLEISKAFKTQRARRNQKRMASFQRRRRLKSGHSFIK